MSNSVTISETKNTVSVNETTNTVTITVGDATTVEVATQGPQGATFSSSNTSMTDSAKVDKSIIYYDSAAGEYKADANWTVSTLVFGGSF